MMNSIYPTEQADQPDNPDLADDGNTGQDDNEFLNGEDAQSAIIGDAIVFDDGMASVYSQDPLYDPVLPLTPDADLSLSAADDTAHAHQHGLHDHHDKISFAGYSSCHRCSCGGFSGNGQCCDNCGHNYHDHY